MYIYMYILAYVHREGERGFIATHTTHAYSHTYTYSTCLLAVGYSVALSRHMSP